ncbi:uncharacterized protein JCM6883_002652 [Sporobolomyces salmoneus]|uniref:uncharacterized protein n=1 Tax=Sporobolomyces salmoneus TaxID=183962 RepID=UPI0031736375
MAEDYGGWVPKDSESPAEREKRMKPEKRAAKLAQVNGSGGGGEATPASGGATGGGVQLGGGEIIDGWVAPAGETPAEREKRQKREKRAAYLAAQNGGSAGGGGNQYTQPQTSFNAGGGGGARSNENFDGWVPKDSESPAEREKRIKREKRAAYLASQGQTAAPQDSSSSGNYYPPPTTDSAPPPALAEGGTRAIHPSRLAVNDALARETGDKKGKHAQSMTPARVKYLQKKKLRAKGRKVAAGKGGKNNNGAEGSQVGGESVAVSSAVGGKRKRDETEDGGSDAETANGDDKYAGLTAEEKEAKVRKIAELKAMRKEARLAKKAELKRIKAEGGVVPPPKPRQAATTSKLKTTTVVKAPSPSPEQPAEPTEEELAQQKEREEIEARKVAKRQKREQRRLAAEEKTKEEEETKDEDVEMSTLIPTGRSPTPPTAMSTIADQPIDSNADTSIPPAEPIEASPVEPEAPSALLRLPSATRPAPPSAKTLSTLNIHESVRNKQVVDPTKKVKIGNDAKEDGVGVGERGRKRLRGDMGIEEWFAVQTAVLPILLPPTSRSPTLYSPFNPPRDVCVSAPTGSGKTLSYVVPIVETLQHRIVTRLRALVLLPTRDLVGQVRETFEGFSKGTGLKIGVATGQHSFAHEQSVLVGDDLPESLEGGSSQVDILIATPGRLIDHLKSTKGFSLQHLRFLVVDEADRLLTQSFHDWLPTILAALKPTSSVSSSVEEFVVETGDELVKADAVAPAWWDAEGKVGRIASGVDERSQSSCQKLLFSATLSRDPAKIDALHLHRPIYISVEDALDPHAEDEQIDDELKFTFPAELSEHMIISPSTHKPLYLFHLLHSLSITSALCFTKSVESATRLAKLVEFFEDAHASSDSAAKRVVVKAYSSELAPGERKKVLKDFKAGEIQMLICSDLISRGIDISNVSHVISYDVPTDMRKYVHRVGRTARAGQTGQAWSLVEEQEVAPFKAIMSSAQHYQKIERVRVKEKVVEPFVPSYQVALDKLRTFFSTNRESTNNA